MSALLNESAFGGHKSETRSRLKISTLVPLSLLFFHLSGYSSPYLWEKDGRIVDLLNKDEYIYSFWGKASKV